MRIALPYLAGSVPLEVPGENLMMVAEPNEYRSDGEAAFLLERALDCPLAEDGKETDGQGLAGFLSGGKRLLVIINDATRPTPTETILSGILPAVLDSGAELSLLVAAGAHRAPTENEYRQILGTHYQTLRGRSAHHDARAETDHIMLGTTSRGTPVLLNRKLAWADRIIATGSVEPHYFAGFTGGRKAFLPGIAAYQTIEANHRLALSPEARSLKLEGNPVHLDMMEAVPLLPAPVFSVMTVLDREQGAAAIYTGELNPSFYAAAAAARDIFRVAVPAKADIVISAARFPMDIDLYQSQKAIDNAACAVKDGGALILVSSCRDGVGDQAYISLLAGAATPSAALETIRAGYRLGYHKAAKMAEAALKASLIAVTELGAELLQSVFIAKAAKLQTALDDALSRARTAGVPVPTVLVLPDGCVTVPDPEL